MDEWVVVAVLPNISVGDAVEGEIIALVSSDDPRILALREAHPNLGQFLERFTDAFGKRIEPAVLILKRDAPRSVFTVEALASFRDAIALSVVPYSRALEIRYDRNHQISYANSFWFYPWNLDKNYDSMIGQTLAILATHQVSKFQGQSNPEIFPMRLARSGIDAPLLTALLKRWRKRYVSQRPKWADVALFRSLNMANQAALLPAGSDVTIFDIGRSLALWVSAFEILAHPKTSYSGLGTVYALLEKVPWESRRSKRRYKCHEVGGKKGPSGTKQTPRRPLACWIYGELYKARNNFLHGNPVTGRSLSVKGSQHSLFQFAALLYRMALTSFLKLEWTASMPPMSKTEEVGKYIAARTTFLTYQRTIEDALNFAKPKSRT